MASETPEKQTPTLSESDTKMFISIMKNLTSDIQFDADAVAAECGYKSGAVMKTRWGQIKKNKLGLISGTTPAKASPKKRKGTEGGDYADGETPKKPAKRGRKPKAKKEEDEEEDEGQGEGGQTVKAEEDEV